MELNKKQTEFWAVLLIICLVVSVAIMLVDFQIKQAILEESTRLKLAMEAWEVRTSGQGKTNKRIDNDVSDNGTVPAPILVDPATRMETGNVSNGDTATSDPARKTRRKPE